MLWEKCFNILHWSRRELKFSTPGSVVPLACFFLAFLISDIASAILVMGQPHFTVFFLCFVFLSYLVFKLLFVFIFIECAGCIVSSSISAHKLSSATEQVVYISWSLCKKLHKNIEEKYRILNAGPDGILVADPPRTFFKYPTRPLPKLKHSFLWEIQLLKWQIQ